MQPRDYVQLAAETRIPLSHGEREIHRFTVRDFIASGAGPAGPERGADQHRVPDEAGQRLLREPPQDADAARVPDGSAEENRPLRE